MNKNMNQQYQWVAKNFRERDNYSESLFKWKEHYDERIIVAFLSDGWKWSKTIGFYH